MSGLTEPKITGKKIGYFILYILIAFISFKLFNTVQKNKENEPSVEYKKPSEEQINQIVNNIANMLNDKTPEIVDENWRADSVIGSLGKKLTFYYSLINHSIDEVDPKKLQKDMSLTLENRADTTIIIKYLLSRGISVIYDFKDKDGNHITDVKITPSDYGY